VSAWKSQIGSLKRLKQCLGEMFSEKLKDESKESNNFKPFIQCAFFIAQNKRI